MRKYLSILVLFVLLAAAGNAVLMHVSAAHAGVGEVSMSATPNVHARFVQLAPIADPLTLRVHLLALDADGGVWEFHSATSEWKFIKSTRNPDQSDAGWLD